MDKEYKLKDLAVECGYYELSIQLCPTNEETGSRKTLTLREFFSREKFPDLHRNLNRHLKFPFNILGIHLL